MYVDWGNFFLIYKWSLISRPIKLTLELMKRLDLKLKDFFLVENGNLS
jgi:hypothetical protein